MGRQAGACVLIACPCLLSLTQTHPRHTLIYYHSEKRRTVDPRISRELGAAPATLGLRVVVALGWVGTMNDSTTSA